MLGYLAYPACLSEITSPLCLLGTAMITKEGQGLELRVHFLMGVKKCKYRLPPFMYHSYCKYGL